MAVDWFNSWIEKEDGRNWVVLLGEYGTGKTALTKYLQYQWLIGYKDSPIRRIPLRIELREFTRQFDTDSLLHHFLDKNNLGYVPVTYLRHLIKSGRIALLLDGYDEMAQFMNARERRICLAALATLASDGAKGVLTSRPNYFTETEELGVFEALYATLERSHYYFGTSDKDAIDEERLVDNLLDHHIINKRERYLRDLDPAQTRGLISKKLGDDEVGKEIVLGILSSIFRSEGDGTQHSLSGKPVIVSSLLELIDDLKLNPEKETSGNREFTEFMVYKMIVDRLMLRDYRRSPSVSPDSRRQCLQQLAVLLSQRDSATASEDDLFSIIDSVFKVSLLRLSGEERRSYRDQLFQDIRSSATLTRNGDSVRDAGSDAVRGDGWRFSHNSLREYLVLERILLALHEEQPFRWHVAVSDLMRQFFASRSIAEISRSFEKTKSYWSRRDHMSSSVYLGVMWKAIEMSQKGAIQTLSELCFNPETKRVDISNISLSQISLDGSSTRLHLKLDGRDSVISMANFLRMNLRGSIFDRCIFESTEIKDCNLSEVSFRDCIFIGGVIENVTLVDADFRGMDKSSELFVRDLSAAKPNVISGDELLGYLNFNGAITDEIGEYYKIRFHKKFPIAFKICANISEQKNSQLRGLTQRGAAQSDPAFARNFVDFLSSIGFIEFGNNNLVSVTPEGRGPITRFVKHNDVFDGLKDFLDRA